MTLPTQDSAASIIEQRLHAWSREDFADPPIDVAQDILRLFERHDLQIVRLPVKRPARPLRIQVD